MNKITKEYFKHPLVEELVGTVESFGGEVLLAPRKFFSKGSDANFCPNTYSVFLCSYDKESGRLLPLSDFILNLAHETRHLLHMVSNKYSSYYSYALGFEDKPKILVGLNAERDCDKWAVKYVEKHKLYLNIPKKRRRKFLSVKYPIDGVFGYDQYKMLARKK